MFLHLYIYRLKCLLRDKPNIFWTLLFPILLATLFHFAFSNLMREKTMAPIPVAVVEDQGWQNDDGIFRAFMNEISTGENPIINLTLGSHDETLSLLENDQVDGVIQVDETIHLKVKTTGLNQTIIKSLLDHFIQNKASITAIIATNPQSMEAIRSAIILFSINVFVMMLAALSIGFLVSLFVKVRNVQSAMANVISLGLCFLSGVFVPQLFLGDSVLKVAQFNPVFWFVKANETIGNLSVINQETLGPVFMDMGIVLAFAVAVFAVAMVVSRVQREKG